MKKVVIVTVALALGLAGPGQSAVAGGWYYHPYHHHHHHHHHHGWHCGDVLLAAGVAVAGLAVLDAVLSEPRTVVYERPVYYAPPPPVVYAPPPPVVYAPPPVVYAPPAVVVPVRPVCPRVYVVPRVVRYRSAVYCVPPPPRVCPPPAVRW